MQTATNSIAHPGSYRTERLVLRTLGPESAEMVRAYLLRNREAHKPFEEIRSDAFYTSQAVQERLAADIAAAALGRGLRMWIFHPEHAHTVLGMVNVSNIVRGAFLSGFLGYALDCEFEGRGFMTEAVGEAVRVGFTDLGLHRIEANVMPRNAKSLAVLERNGFVREGLARKYLRIAGVWEDHVHMVRFNEAME